MKRHIVLLCCSLLFLFGCSQDAGYAPSKAKSDVAARPVVQSSQLGGGGGMHAQGAIRGPGHIQMEAEGALPAMNGAIAVALALAIPERPDSAPKLRMPR